MARRYNRKEEKATETVDMSRYVDSDPIVEQCKGCNKVFSFEWQADLVTLEAKKCLTYPNPASKWAGEGEKFAMMTATIRDIDDKGKPALIEKEIPVIEKICPVASHVKLREIVNTDSKRRFGQQKHGRR